MLSRRIIRNVIFQPSRCLGYKHGESLGNADIPVSLYGGRHIVTMLPGHGIGPELMKHVEDVLKFINAPVDFEKIDINDGPNLEQDINNAVISVMRNGCGIKGAIKPTTSSPNFLNPNVEIRTKLDLFVHLTRCKSYSGVPAKYRDIDIVMIRQNTEGEYAMLEHEAKNGIVESLKIITQSNTDRFARWAFDFATKHGKTKVTIVHKANIMKLSDGLFLKTVKEVGKEYPHIKLTDTIVDNCSMQLVSKPQQYEILVMPNLYGTVLNNIACGLTGGAGLTGSSNYGTRYAVFETACRNVGKSLEGKNIANPVATLNSVVSMLYYLKRDTYARIIKEGIEKTLSVDGCFTQDLGGVLSTTEMMDVIKDNICTLYAEKFAHQNK